jgi:hypothetical protein
MTAENGPLISSSEAPAMYPSPKRGQNREKCPQSAHVATVRPELTNLDQSRIAAPAS